MREAFGDLWEFHAAPNAVACITTNGYVNGRGECVMGRGVALQAKKRFPGLAKTVGFAIRQYGNHVRRFNLTPTGPRDTWIVVFPTKHVWWKPSDLELIRQSAGELRTLAHECSRATFYLPRPGCANGGRTWEEVRPVLESVGLPDNVVVIDRVRSFPDMNGPTVDLSGAKLTPEQFDQARAYLQEQADLSSHVVDVDRYSSPNPPLEGVLKDVDQRIEAALQTMSDGVLGRRFLCLGCTEGEHHLCNPAEHCECDHNQPVPDFTEVNREQ